MSNAHKIHLASKSSRKRAARKHREQIEEDQDGRCFICGHKHFLTLHHIIALEDDGDSNRENLMGLCVCCHRMWHGIGGGCTSAAWIPSERIFVTTHSQNDVPAKPKRKKKKTRKHVLSEKKQADVAIMDLDIVPLPYLTEFVRITWQDVSTEIQTGN